MTRKELIEQEAQRLGQMYFPDESNIWARPNYEAQYVSNACMQMAEWERKRLVEKACEWIQYYIVDGLGHYIVGDIIGEFRKAMEE